MPYRYTKKEFGLAVTGEDLMVNANNPDEPKFMPDWAHVVDEGEKINVLVSGPLQSRTTGKLLKQKRGLASFDESDINDPEIDVPGWVVDLIEEVKGMRPSPARNVSSVRDPKWTGADGEYAVVVGRGEPRRSDEQLREIVGDQVERYMTQFGDKQYTVQVLDLTVDLIAHDYIDPVGSQSVMLTREHLFAFVRLAMGKLMEENNA